MGSAKEVVQILDDRETLLKRRSTGWDGRRFRAAEKNTEGLTKRAVRSREAERVDLVHRVAVCVSVSSVGLVDLWVNAGELASLRVVVAPYSIAAWDSPQALVLSASVAQDDSITPKLALLARPGRPRQPQRSQRLLRPHFVPSFRPLLVSGRQAEELPEAGCQQAGSCPTRVQSASSSLPLVFDCFTSVAVSSKESRSRPRDAIIFEFTEGHEVLSSASKLRGEFSFANRRP